MKTKNGIEIPTTNQLQILSNKLQLRTNDTLRHEEWQMIDDELLMVARERLTAIADLQSMGLVKNLGGLGVMVSAYERSTDMTEAQVNMDGVTEAQKDRQEYDLVGVPVPIFSKNFSFNSRQIEASRMRGESLDVTAAAMAQRKVLDSLESMAFNGVSNLVVDGKQIYGYITHPNRETLTLAGTGWATVAGRDPIGDVEKMLQKAYDIDRYGPFLLYVCKEYWGPIQADYSTAKGDRTFKERIEAFADITEVKVAPALPNNSVVLVQMTKDTVDLAVGQDISNIEWESKPMLSEFKTFAAMAIRVKADANNTVGVVHGSV